MFSTHEKVFSLSALQNQIEDSGLFAGEFLSLILDTPLYKIYLKTIVSNEENLKNSSSSYAVKIIGNSEYHYFSNYSEMRIFIERFMMKDNECLSILFSIDNLDNSVFDSGNKLSLSRFIDGSVDSISVLYINVSEGHNIPIFDVLRTRSPSDRNFYLLSGYISENHLDALKVFLGKSGKVSVMKDNSGLILVS